MSGSWIYKGEWNGTINNNIYVEARYGVFGYYFPLLANTDTTAHETFDNAAHAAHRRATRRNRPTASAVRPPAR